MEAKLFIQNFEEAIFACENDDDPVRIRKFIGEMVALSPNVMIQKYKVFIQLKGFAIQKLWIENINQYIEWLCF